MTVKTAMKTEQTAHDVPEVVVTSALPYANGPVHIGHLVEYIQTDVYVRALKLLGKRAVYCCAGDTHGAPIEINATKQGITPEALVGKYLKEHQEDFAKYLIAFDSYYSTNSDENKHFAEAIYAALKKNGHISEKELELTYCEHDKRFLPDRYVKGQCPKCGAPDQYGDVCEKCNATYNTTDLVEPYCTLCKNAPVRKTSTHLFFKLSSFAPFLQEWLRQHPTLQPEIKNQVLGWVNAGLQDWCISRDGPYFGFKIPGTEKYFYVWLDAPIGYISSLAHYLGDDVQAAERVWNSARVEHFIGKDIVYFHLLFWPAVLHAAGWKVPENIVVHGHLTVNGEKMSKSRGTLIPAGEFAAKLPDTQFLRFYYAASLSHAMTDLDLNLRDFTERVNKELVSNVANFIYRTLSFIEKNYDSKLGTVAADEKADALERHVLEKEALVLKYYQECEFRKAVQEILHIASLGNAYFQEAEPWKRKEDSLPILTTCASLVKDIVLLLEPVLPAFSKKVYAQLGITRELSFNDLGEPLENCSIGKPAIIWTRVEPFTIETKGDGGAKSSSKKNELKKGSTVDDGKKSPAKTMKDEEKLRTTTHNEKIPTTKISPDALDLIAATIVKVEKHPKAEKLYIETLDDGSGTERVIVSGLVPYYAPEALLGKTIVLVNNLKPASLRGVESKGMLLAAQDDAGRVEVLEVAAEPGAKIAVGKRAHGTSEITIDEFFSLAFTVENHQVSCEGDPVTSDGERVTTRLVKNGKVA